MFRQWAFFLGKFHPTTLWVFGVGFVLVVFNSWVMPTVYSDGHIWLPLEREFFSIIDKSVARHRPFFGFLAYLTYAPLSWFGVEPAQALLGGLWRVQNAVLYLLSGILGYLAIYQWKRDRYLALFFSLMILSSVQLYFWLNHTLINVQGFFVLYASLWMWVDYVQCPEQERTRRLWIYGLTYGLLMLGKAQYNLLGTVVAYVILFERSRWKEMALFVVVQAIPLLLWMAFLKLGLEGDYANYEMARSDYSLVDMWIRRYGTVAGMVSLIPYSLWSGVSMTHLGMGLLPAAGMVLVMGYLIKTPEGKLMIVFFCVTAVFLTLANFMILRHAGDFSPIAFLGMAMALNFVRNRFAQSKKGFWSAFCFAFLIWTALNVFRGEPILCGFEAAQENPRFFSVCTPLN